jgi:predicted RNA binding protein YcfA (HicA-like mRNA interferase family)
VSNWPSTRAPQVLAALQRIGWLIKRQSGSHKTLVRENWPSYTWAFHDREELGPRMLARVAKRTGLTPEDLWALVGAAERGDAPVEALELTMLHDARSVINVRLAGDRRCSTDMTSYG